MLHPSNPWRRFTIIQGLTPKAHGCQFEFYFGERVKGLLALAVKDPQGGKTEKKTSKYAVLIINAKYEQEERSVRCSLKRQESDFDYRSDGGLPAVMCVVNTEELQIALQGHQWHSLAHTSKSGKEPYLH
ncbi:hypothetical protein VNO77_41966 [Canavalia gladiata]|uniref:Uncharacterized protein n=1 Tax=Canavalia gladiata TaxID=3824 RepID=A0AAN9K395_CANGL